MINNLRPETNAYLQSAASRDHRIGQRGKQNVSSHARNVDLQNDESSSITPNKYDMLAASFGHIMSDVEDDGEFVL